MEFDKLAYDFCLPQHLSDTQHEVGRRNTFAQLAAQIHANNVWGQNVDRLSEHSGFCLDAAYSPSNDPQAIDHRCMRIGADKSVRIVDAVFLEHSFCKVLKVDLMNDSYPRRHNLKG